MWSHRCVCIEGYGRACTCVCGDRECNFDAGRKKDILLSAVDSLPNAWSECACVFFSYSTSTPFFVLFWLLFIKHISAALIPCCKQFPTLSLFCFCPDSYHLSYLHFLNFLYYFNRFPKLCLPFSFRTLTPILSTFPNSSDRERECKRPSPISSFCIQWRRDIRT